MYHHAHSLAPLKGPIQVERLDLTTEKQGFLNPHLTCATEQHYPLWTGTEKTCLSWEFPQANDIHPLNAVLACVTLLADSHRAKGY